MTLMHPWWLVFALLSILAYLLLSERRDDAWQYVIAAPVLGFLRAFKKRISKRHIGWLIAAVYFIALSSPSIESANKDTWRHTQGWIILADVSRSMTLTDVIPTRLSAMRNTALELAGQAQSRSVTLIVYAGDAFVITPPTYDHDIFTSSTNLLDYGIVPLDGSNVSRALSLSLSVIENSDLINSRLFVLSDTGGFSAQSSAAVARIADLGHRTDLIIFGTDETDNSGKVDLKLANGMAKNGNGVVVRSDTIGNVNYAKLDLNNRAIATNLLTQSGLTTLIWSNQSHWPLLLAIPLFLMFFYRQLRS